MPARSLADMSRFEVTIEYTQTVSFEGIEQTRRERSLLRVSRPDRAALLPLAGGPLEILYADSKARVRRTITNEYAATSVADDLPTLFLKGEFPAAYFA